MRLIQWLIFVVGAAACGTSAGKIDASLGGGADGPAADAKAEAPDAKLPDAELADAADLESLSCPDLQAVARAHVDVLDLSCNEPQDCTILGEIDTCNCTPTLTGDGRGCQISANATAAAGDPALAHVATLIRQKCHTCGGGVGCVCDCAPSFSKCVEHKCVLEPGDGCFPHPDAGP